MKKFILLITLNFTSMAQEADTSAEKMFMLGQEAEVRECFDSIEFINELLITN